MAFSTQRDKPLFEDILWAEPQRNSGRNRVLIIGGHSQSLQAPLDAFRLLAKRRLGAGIVLPDSLRKVLKFGRPPDLELLFAPSTPSGSLATAGYDEIIASSADHDCLFVVGDLSANQETERLILELVADFKGCKLIVGQIANAFLTDRPADPDLHLILSSSQLATLFKQLGGRSAKLPDGPEALGEALAILQTAFSLTAWRSGALWTKTARKVCATFSTNFEDSDEDRLHLAVESVFYLVNNPNKNWPALTSAAWQSRANRE